MARDSQRPCALIDEDFAVRQQLERQVVHLDARPAGCRSPRAGPCRRTPRPGEHGQGQQQALQETAGPSWCTASADDLHPAPGPGPGGTRPARRGTDGPDATPRRHRPSPRRWPAGSAPGSARCPRPQLRDRGRRARADSGPGRRRSPRTYPCREARAPSIVGGGWGAGVHELVDHLVRGDVGEPETLRRESHPGPAGVIDGPAVRSHAVVVGDARVDAEGERAASGRARHVGSAGQNAGHEPRQHLVDHHSAASGTVTVPRARTEPSSRRSQARTASRVPTRSDTASIEPSSARSRRLASQKPSRPRTPGLTSAGGRARRSRYSRTIGR